MGVSRTRSRHATGHARARDRRSSAWHHGAMIRLTVVIGGILAILGVVGYIATAATSLTALIPSAVGVLLLVCATVAARRPANHRHAMHTASVRVTRP